MYMNLILLFSVKVFPLLISQQTWALSSSQGKLPTFCYSVFTAALKESRRALYEAEYAKTNTGAAQVDHEISNYAITFESN